MSIQPVRLHGDPVLRSKSEPVTAFDRSLRRLVEDLHDTLDDQRGAGLAAPQIGVNLRVFVYDLEGRRGHMVNPVVRTIGDQTQDRELEGCLSLPGGLYYRRVRHLKAVASGFDVDGRPIEVRGNGFMARCLQHEADHLDGELFIDGLDPDTRRAFEADLRRQSWHQAEQTSVPAGRSELGGVFFKR
ncbi:peptide deformylase [Glycomyces sp. NPDC046736]|uniref:peptide deformylase n=1 Tax=Glycomyces sp. NPDC046736 TaxID=3155615 RepID=UPI0033DBBDA9